MTFDAYESSRHLGQPVDIYLFRYGPEASHYYAYTSAARDVVTGGITYTATPINRDSPKSSGSLDKTAFKVSVPRDLEVVELFRIYPPSYPVTLVIKSGHLSDPGAEFLAVWTGLVRGYERQDSEVVLTCEPASTSMKRPGLRKHYQIACPHVLYGPDCRANQAARTTTGTVASMSGLSVTLNAGWAVYAVDKYLHGTARWTTADGQVEIRQVLSASGNTLRLDGLLRGLTVGMGISVSAGCNHETGGVNGDCVTLHDNGPNFGGCKWIPLKNPIGVYNRFY